jgi:nitrate reductase beta subunit
MGGSGPFGETSGSPTPIAVENFRMLRDRQTADAGIDPGRRGGRVNLLNWDGKGRPAGLFPARGGAKKDGPARPDGASHEP